MIENPSWQVHSAQEHQLINGPSRSRYSGESPDEDSVVFQRTLKGRIHFDNGTEESPQLTPAEVGSALLFGGPENGARTVLDKENYACHWIRIRGAGLRVHWAFMREQYGNVISLDPTGQAVEVITGIIHDFCMRRWIEPHRLYTWVNLLMEELSTRSRAKLSPAEIACEKIRENPFFPWALKTLASEAGCSREHLSRVFLNRFGQPPATWLRQRRLGRVIRLLESTQIPISQIAEIVGFGSLDSMGRLIQDIHGCTPSHIRASKKTYTPTKDPTFIKER